MSTCQLCSRTRSPAISSPTVLIGATRQCAAVTLCLAALFILDPGSPPLAAASEADGSREKQPLDEPAKEFEVTTLRGRVVWLAEAMARRHGVKTVPEASQSVLALETASGELYPLVEDIRGRGVRRDERLRNMNLELLVRRYRGAPVVQVVRVFELTDKAKFELDYWCDICAIAMYELKPCDCCQGDIELRRRVVEKDGPAQD